MKKILLILFIISSFNAKGAIYQISVWNGYYQFLPPNNITIQLGDTIQWIPLDPPTMYHTITSDNIPVGAVPFNQSWQMPADTFFQYIPQVAGLYQYVCTPHISFGMIGEFMVTNGINIQTYVPDDNFEAYLESNGMGNGIANDDYVTTANINTVTSLYVDNQNITDLTGIEDFTALTLLWCGNNQFTSLDVSNNTALDSLHCYNNQLTSLDVSQNTALTFLGCNYNQLTSLDVSQNTALATLYCDSNQLTSLDVSNNTALTILYCGTNQFTSLNVSNNTALTTLNCYSNNLTFLDVSNNTDLTHLSCSYNQLTSLDVSNNTALTDLYCNHNQLTSLDVSTNTALIYLWCFNNQLISLDVSACTALGDFICYDNQLTSLNLSQNTALTYLDCRNNQLTSFDLRNGNNTNTFVFATDNLDLYCIDVDNVVWSTANWTVANNNIDTQQYFSTNCGVTAIEEHTTNKELLKITDLLGRETKRTNQLLFYIYDDGTVEKRIIIE